MIFKADCSAHYRKVIDVEMNRDGRVWTPSLMPFRVACLCYFYPVQRELLELLLDRCLQRYGEAEHASYRPFPADESIVDLCRKPVHSLRIAAPAAMSVHVFRLLPGDDILESIQMFVKEKAISAGVVLSATGGTRRAVLESPAHRSGGAPKVLAGVYAINSISGVVSVHGHRLQASLSDEECRCFAGELAVGCKVHDSVEVVLGEVCGGVTFSRPYDARTGHYELSIDAPAPGVVSKVPSTADREEAIQAFELLPENPADVPIERQWARSLQKKKKTKGSSPGLGQALAERQEQVVGMERVAQGTLAEEIDKRLEIAGATAFAEAYLPLSPNRPG